MIISPYVNTPHKFAPKLLFTHAKLFREKSSPILCVCVCREGQGGGTFISFPISKSFVPTFCGTNYDFSSKTT